MTGRWRGHTTVTPTLAGDSEFILTETPQRFERVSRTFWAPESRCCALEWRCDRLGVRHATRHHQSNIRIAAERGLWRRWRIHARRERRDSFSKKDGSGRGIPPAPDDPFESDPLDSRPTASQSDSSSVGASRRSVRRPTTAFPLVDDRRGEVTVRWCRRGQRRGTPPTPAARVRPTPDRGAGSCGSDA